MSTMPANSPLVYLNGQYLPRQEARLDIEDRGTMFGDGVYEVVRYYNGRGLDVMPHLDRLRRSMRGIALDAPDDIADLPGISHTLIQRNDLQHAKVYWQVTRGPAPRDHAFPGTPTPTVLAIAYPAPAHDPDATCPSCTALLHEDRRWGDCWIKSLMLLPNVLAREAARRAGCDEAILHRDRHVTEGASTNVFIVNNGELRTHPADAHILGGITRDTTLKLAKQAGITVHERAGTTDELRAADEVILTGTSLPVSAVTTIDGARIGDGRPGPVARRLHAAFMQHIATQCGSPARE